MPIYSLTYILYCNILEPGVVIYVVISKPHKQSKAAEKMSHLCLT